MVKDFGGLLSMFVMKVMMREEDSDDYCYSIALSDFWASLPV